MTEGKRIEDGELLLIYQRSVLKLARRSADGLEGDGENGWMDFYGKRI